jgi:hypothetical protein
LQHPVQEKDKYEGFEQEKDDPLLQNKRVNVNGIKEYAKDVKHEED